MSQTAKPSESKVPEPSIDEILASIRRSIVPEDDAGKPAHRKPPPRKPVSAAVTAPVPPGARGGRRGDDETAGNGANGAPGQRIGEAAEAAGAADGGDDGPAWSNGESRTGGVDPGRGDPTEGSGDDAAAGGAAAGAGGTTVTGPVAADAALLSPHATAAVDVAFNALTHTMLSQNPRTLEDLVRDMLRPMLKAWLDANLPAMVERLVRAEIERVSRRG
jgi:uncharacterized protein